MIYYTVCSLYIAVYYFFIYINVQCIHLYMNDENDPLSK